jgi:hypothetical protein
LLFILPFLIATFKPKRNLPSPAVSVTTTTSSKGQSKEEAAQLTKEMQFDLTLTRISFAVDVLSQTFVSIAPVNSTAASQAMFVGFSVLSSFGSGVIPTVQSLALGYVKAAAENGEEQSRMGAGKLFGAIAALQAVGQMILGVTPFHTPFRTKLC